MLDSFADTAADIAAIDGRVLRGIRTRRAIIAAAQALLRSSGREPTLKEIADHAAVSPRIVSRYYGDLGGLIVALMDNLRETLVARYVAVQPAATRDDRIATYVDLRIDLCERYAPVWLRAVQMDRFTPEMDRLMMRSYDDLRSLAMNVFAPDLRPVHADLHRDVLDQLAMYVDAYNWRFHRQICNRTPDEAKAMMRSAIWRVLAF